MVIVIQQVPVYAKYLQNNYCSLYPQLGQYLNEADS